MTSSLRIIKGVVGKVVTVEAQKHRMVKMSKVNMASAMALQHDNEKVSYADLLKETQDP